ncbi:MAG: leucyl/phenylalanyl-tRNA--protein transferase [Muribaculaceae bacterium]|nr:leucyl/phenylalanyl-tRNA--protein transferase [Muribaculaceae bacterium]
MGADLSVGRLLEAYSKGIFPWFSFRDWPFPLWYCPMDRFVIFPEEIHVSHSMRTLINSGRYRVTFNEAFREVIEACGSVDSRYEHEGAWLGVDMTEAYTRLHELGHAMSVEVWEGEKLAGGLYGVTVGKVFCGESMFSRVPNGSKLALIHLARTLSRTTDSNSGFLIDCQFETPHLKSMGGRHFPYIFYLSYLHPAE